MAVWVHLACCEDFPLGVFECEDFTFVGREEVWADGCRRRDWVEGELGPSELAPGELGSAVG